MRFNSLKCIIQSMKCFGYLSKVMQYNSYHKVHGMLFHERKQECTWSKQIRKLVDKLFLSLYYTDIP